ncbi:hypothetical protein SDC9_183346 [bioreactor metagenome]|uniref:Uncharacterized protein n=1 Tax=bioreactor metagenome TaxID=1076179 RepID=A0A645HI94_9ZZZZ
MWLVNKHKRHYSRIICWCKGHKAGYILSAASREFLASSCFTADAVALYLCLASCSLCHYALQYVTHGSTCFLTYCTLITVPVKDFIHIPIAVLCSDCKVRSNQSTAVNNSCCCTQKLYGCNLEGLAKAHCCKLNRAYILFFMQDTDCLTVKVNTRFFIKPKLNHIIIKPVSAYSFSHLHKYAVAGVLYAFLKSLCTMRTRKSPTLNLPSADCH